MFLPLNELALVVFAIRKFQFSESFFHIIFPCPLIGVAIFVPVHTEVTQIITKLASENVTIKEHKLTFHFLVIFPSALKKCALAIKVISHSLP